MAFFNTAVSVRVQRRENARRARSRLGTAGSDYARDARTAGPRRSGEALRRHDDRGGRRNQDSAPSAIRQAVNLN
ncbi:hypothetical protein PCLA_19r0097 [Pseudomonas citronellolis]|nr:hypothetical protein PCLA_19r0097 [Pseudomonas citronellolis]